MKSKMILSLCVVCVALGLVASCASSPSKTSESDTRPGVVVFPFEVKSTDPAEASLGSDVAQAITESLLHGAALRPVEREQLNKIMVEQEFSASGLVKEEDALTVGRLSGARFIILGSISSLAGQVRINARMLDVETAEITLAESVYGKKSTIFSLETQLAKKLEEGLK